MHKNIYSLTISKLILTLGFVFFLFSNNAEAKKRIAVLPFEVLSDKAEYKQLGLGTMDTLSVAMTSVPDFIMIDRGRVSNVLKEQSFQKSGITDVKESVSLGKIMGAEILITGSIQTFDNEFRITASFIEVETGKILKASKVTGNNIFQLQDKLADQLLELEKVTLNEQQRTEITKITNSTNNNQAFDYYTTGKTYYYKALDYSLSNKGTSDEYLKNTTLALENFDKAISLDNNYFLAIASKSETQSLLFSFFESQENVDSSKLDQYFFEAKKNAELAFSLSKKSGIVYRSFALANFVTHNIPKTIEYAKKAVEYNPNDMESYVWLSMGYYMEGSSYLYKEQIELAITSFQNCIKINPRFTNAYYALGEIYEKKHDDNSAVIFYLKALKTYPDYPKIKTALVKLYHKMAIEAYQKEDFITVEAIYNSIIDINPKDADAYNNLGAKYFMDKNYKKAEAMYKKAIEVEPKRDIFYENLGLVYDAMKKTFEAKIWYRKACELGNKNSCEMIKN